MILIACKELHWSVQVQEISTALEEIAQIYLLLFASLCDVFVILLWHKIPRLLPFLESVPSIFFWEPARTIKIWSQKSQLWSLLKLHYCNDNNCIFSQPSWHESCVESWWLYLSFSWVKILFRKCFQISWCCGRWRRAAGKWVVIKPVMALITLETWREIRKK